MKDFAVKVSGKDQELWKVPAIETLTDREMQVMLLRFKGMTHNQIGGDLGISPRTCEVYQKNALKRLGVSNSFLAMREFLRAGYLGKILEET